jgi:hypothetical protein
LTFQFSDPGKRSLTIAKLLYPTARGGQEDVKLGVFPIAAGPVFDPQVGVFTGNGGSLLVRGEVASQADADALKAIVEESRPPAPVTFSVRLRMEPETLPRE